MAGRNNRKAIQQEEDKKTEIEKNNLILFNKMRRIMNRGDPCNRPPSQGHKRNSRKSMELTRIE